MGQGVTEDCPNVAREYKSGKLTKRQRAQGRGDPSQTQGSGSTASTHEQPPPKNSPSAPYLRLPGTSPHSENKPGGLRWCREAGDPSCTHMERATSVPEVPIQPRGRGAGGGGRGGDPSPPLRRLRGSRRRPGAQQPRFAQGWSGQRGHFSTTESAAAASSAAAAPSRRAGLRRPPAGSPRLPEAGESFPAAAAAVEVNSPPGCHKEAERLLASAAAAAAAAGGAIRALQPASVPPVGRFFHHQSAGSSIHGRKGGGGNDCAQPPAPNNSQLRISCPLPSARLSHTALPWHGDLSSEILRGSPAPPSASRSLADTLSRGNRSGRSGG